MIGKGWIFIMICFQSISKTLEMIKIDDSLEEKQFTNKVIRCNVFIKI